MQTHTDLLRKTPRRHTTALGDRIVTQRGLDLTHTRIVEHVEVSHPRDVSQVAFTRQVRT